MCVWGTAWRADALGVPFGPHFNRFWKLCDPQKGTKTATKSHKKINEFFDTVFNAFCMVSGCPNRCQTAPKNHQKYNMFPQDFRNSFFMLWEGPKPWFFQYLPYENAVFTMRPDRHFEWFWYHFRCKNAVQSGLKTHAKIRRRSDANLHRFWMDFGIILNGFWDLKCHQNPIRKTVHGNRPRLKSLQTSKSI